MSIVSHASQEMESRTSCATLIRLPVISCFPNFPPLPLESRLGVLLDVLPSGVLLIASRYGVNLGSRGVDAVGFVGPNELRLA